MGYIIESSEWSPTIYQVEFETPVLGGSPEYQNGIPTGGFSNVAVQQLANRTQWLLSKASTNELALATQKSFSESVSATLTSHIGSGGDSHALATEVSHGFMSASDKLKLDNLASVAMSNDYRDLNNKPPIDYVQRNTDFEARVGDRYYLTNSLNVALPDPSFYGLIQGDFISMNKRPDIICSVSPSAGVLIYTSVGGVSQSTTLITYDIDDEIIFVFDGTNWQV